jgi:hypothetical protein
VVDDFGIKYQKVEDVNALLEILRLEYTIKDDWAGCSYVGFKVLHNRTEGTISLSMPNYIREAAQRFGVSTTKGVDNPLGPLLPDETKDDPPANPQELKRLQQIIGVLLYYARAVDPTVLTRISKLSTQQKNSNISTLQAAERTLQYLATQPEAAVVFHKSDMRLICYSDASYLGETRSRSRCGGMFYLGDSNISTLNGPILSRSSVIDAVTSSAAESELAAAFMNAKEAAYIRNILQAFGYQQQKTPIMTDNSFVFSVVNGTCKAKRSRAMDMRYHWLRDRVDQGQFEVIWCKGEINIADHLTKDLPTDQLRSVRAILVGAHGTTGRGSVLQLAGPSKKASRLEPVREARGVCCSRTETSLEDTQSITPLSLPHVEDGTFAIG